MLLRMQIRRTKWDNESQFVRIWKTKRKIQSLELSTWIGAMHFFFFFFFESMSVEIDRYGGSEMPTGTFMCTNWSGGWSIRSGWISSEFHEQSFDFGQFVWVEKIAQQLPRSGEILRRRSESQFTTSQLTATTTTRAYGESRKASAIKRKVDALARETPSPLETWRHFKLAAKSWTGRRCDDINRLRFMRIGCGSVDRLRTRWSRCSETSSGDYFRGIGKI